MEKILSLREKKAFSLLYKTGRTTDSGLFRLFSKKNKREGVRFAVVVPRAVAKRAVVRNRLRRRAREWIRKNYTDKKKGFDLVIFFKKGAAEAPKTQFYQELHTALSCILD